MSLAILITLGACGPEDSSTADTTQIAETESLAPSHTPPPSPPELKVAYELDPIPESLFADWASAEGMVVVQTPLTAAATLADLYVLSPDKYGELKASVRFLAIGNPAVLEVVNPAFVSHSFDFDNRFALPWRWTPYVFALRRDLLAQAQLKWSIRDWFQWDRSLWPDAPRLMTGLWMKQKGMSCNLAEKAELKKTLTELRGLLSSKQAPMRECWSKLQQGDIYATVGPAAWIPIRDIQAGETNPLEWRIPANGTLVHFDHLCARLDGLYAAKAAELAWHLLNTQQQRQIATASGYLPAASEPGRELEASPIALPPLGKDKSDWFQQSEFLTWRPSPHNGDDSISHASDKE
jgi:spermidine/putrescine-binding protein